MRHRAALAVIRSLLPVLVSSGTLMAQLGVAEEAQVVLTLDAGSSVRQMAGGMGASWHAIRVEPQFEDPSPYAYDIRHDDPQGSAVGGNPPLDSPAWGDIYRLGSWLGMDWLRVELDRRMYEPEKDRFDWDNEEMRTLYRILDWCQQNGADVFLTEMWRDVEWLAYPDVHPILSAPNSLDDFAEGLATLAEHLLRAKQYTCIKWLCIANEPPGGTWGYWWSRGPDDAPLAPAFKAVREALDRRGIALPLSGPDWVGPPELDPAKLGFARHLGAFDLHSYGTPSAEFSRVLGDWARWAHEQGKPLFLSEMGDMSLGWRDADPGPKSFEAALSAAEKVIRGLNAGVDGFNRWSFLNRGDLDGQWQHVRTWDLEGKRYLEHAEPEPVPYYGYAMLTRFTAKYSDVLSCAVDSRDTERRVFAAGLRSPQGDLTLIVANREDSAAGTRFLFERLDRETALHVYELTEDKVQQPGFRLSPEARVQVSPSQPELSRTLPSKSMTVLTSYDLAPAAPGIVGSSATKP